MFNIRLSYRSFHKRSYRLCRATRYRCTALIIFFVLVISVWQCLIFVHISSSFDTDNYLNVLGWTRCTPAPGPTTTIQGFQELNILRKLDRDSEAWRDAVEDYMMQRRRLCHIFEELIPKTVSLATYCPCIPDGLVGYQKVTSANIPLNISSKLNPAVMPGGRWFPLTCTSRLKLAIIIPYRDRLRHLQTLLHRLHPILQRQMTEYTVYVVEQRYPSIFNKAALMNVGYVHARDKTQADCYIFHDVDFIPEDDRHFYTCRPTNPLHLGAFHNSHGYILNYYRIFGAVTAFTPYLFEKLNGFSNRYYGWGGEDDDMSFRIKEKYLDIIRDHKQVAGYTVLQHERDHGNYQPDRGKMLLRLFDDRRTDTDGLNSLDAKISSVKNMPLYTWVLVDLPASSDSTTESSVLISQQ